MIMNLRDSVMLEFGAVKLSDKKVEESKYRRGSYACNQKIDLIFYL